MSKVVRFRSPEQFRRHAVAAVAPAPRRSIRRIELPLEDPAFAPTENVLWQRISDELDFAWRQLDLAAASINRDTVSATRHRPSLHTVDMVGQTLGQLAVVLRSSLPEAAVERVPMADLRGRLQRSGGIR
ncbi:hypothetical protein OMW55_02185 [Sphingomonas sp. BN140010]|uniref:Uncharacterized protein n=1 Tax=Sphingomonas arvum TaxID=2992113 RepID=A0ABT3JC50_9SPHN|nr:hypothetical protein [Sphingomonas sp. BN140010]MCW3796619.1 hypothetical protein [Sphingomonas sp. BN140010]